MEAEVLLCGPVSSLGLQQATEIAITVAYEPSKKHQIPQTRASIVAVAVNFIPAGASIYLVASRLAWFEEI